MSVFPDFRSPHFDIETYNSRFREANVIIDAAAREVAYPEHWGGLSVKCVFSGAEYYRCSDVLYKIDASSFLIFNEGKLYSSWINESTRTESFTLNMSPTFEVQATAAILSSNQIMLDDPFRKPPDRLHFLECLYPHQGEITALIKRMRGLAKDTPANHHRLEELFYELFVSMRRLQDRSFPVARNNSFLAPSRIELHQRLLRARDFMFSCFHEDIDLSKLADIACLNKYYFLRQFKNAFGLTPHQFLTQRRLASAAERLRKTTQSISSICTDIGFSDPASFSKLFRRTAGASPLQYRRRNGTFVDPWYA